MSEQMFLAESITPFALPVVPDVKIRLVSASGSGVISRKVLSPELRSSSPFFKRESKLSHERVSFISPSSEIRIISSGSFSFTSRSFSPAALSKNSARQEAAFIIPAISSGISSLSIGTTTPVPQVIERYAQHHCGEFLPITAIFSPLSPKEHSAVPRAFTLLRRFL